jgi:hypothetical protein
LWRWTRKAGPGRSRLRRIELLYGLRCGTQASTSCPWLHPLCKPDWPTYIRKMRSRFIWLMPILLLLISVIGSANVYAHSSPSAGLEASGGGHQALEGDVQSPIQVSAASAVESRAPCDCPAGHCVCNADCLAMCATTAAIADTIAFDFFPVRSTVLLERMKFSAEWIPNRDFDPPRPTA